MMSLLRSLAVLALAAALCLGAYADDTAKKQDAAQPQKDPKKPGPKKGEEDAKKLLTAKAIPLTDAIRIAQKNGKGMVVKAELRLDKEGQPVFKIDLLGEDGAKVKVDLDASGKLIESQKPAPPAAKPEK